MNVVRGVPAAQHPDVSAVPVNVNSYDVSGTAPVMFHVHGAEPAVMVTSGVAVSVPEPVTHVAVEMGYAIVNDAAPATNTNVGVPVYGGSVGVLLAVVAADIRAGGPIAPLLHTPATVSVYDVDGARPVHVIVPGEPATDPVLPFDKDH